MGISPQQFEQMQKRLDRKPGAASLSVRAVAPTAAAHQVILGVDPSLRGTGFGIIRLARPHPETLVQGTVRCPAQWERSRCLVKIADALRETLREHRPTVCVVEGLFFAQNLQTALIMGEARGAALVAVAEAGLEIFEIAPRKMKQAVVGYGAAQKIAVARMVQRMLGLAETPAADAADALALALTYAMENTRHSLTQPRRV